MDDHSGQRRFLALARSHEVMSVPVWRAPAVRMTQAVDSTEMARASVMGRGQESRHPSCISARMRTRVCLGRAAGDQLRKLSRLRCEFCQPRGENRRHPEARRGASGEGGVPQHGMSEQTSCRWKTSYMDSRPEAEATATRTESSEPGSLPSPRSLIGFRESNGKNRGIPRERCKKS